MAERGIIFSAPMVRALLDGRKTQTRRLAPQPPTECSMNYMLGNESWLRAEDRTPIRRTFEAWGGPLFDAKPDKALCGSFEIVPPHQLGDRLYVREAWHVRGVYSDVVEIGYRASETRGHTEYVEQVPVDLAPRGKGDWPRFPKYGPSIHMPRWASRLTLTVTDVRVQRLQDISEDDARAEGVERCDERPDLWRSYGQSETASLDRYTAARASFISLWNSLHDKPGTGWDDNPWLYALTFTVQHGNIDRIA